MAAREGYRGRMLGLIRTKTIRYDSLMIRCPLRRRCAMMRGRSGVTHPARGATARGGVAWDGNLQMFDDGRRAGHGRTPPGDPDRKKLARKARGCALVVIYIL